MRGTHSSANPFKQLQGPRRGQPLLHSQFLPQGDPLQQFHNQKHSLRRFHSEVIHGHHVWMREASRHLRFLPEFLDRLLVREKFVPNHLHRHLPVQRHIRRPIHLSHSALPQLSFQAIASRQHARRCHQRQPCSFFPASRRSRVVTRSTYGTFLKRPPWQYRTPSHQQQGQRARYVFQKRRVFLAV